MTLFQWLTIPLFAFLLLAEIVACVRRGCSSRMVPLRMAISFGAAVAIAFPEIPQGLANLFGIQRGADLVFYGFVLAFLGTTFSFYARHLRLERQLTQLVRHVAIQNAQRGTDQERAPR